MASRQFETAALENELARRRPDNLGQSAPARVLIVDDEGPIRELLSDVLDMQGCESLAVPGLAEAALALRGEMFDVVMVDIFLGDSGTGLDLLPLIRETQPHTQAIVMSGMAETDDVITALKAGAYDMLCKPFNIGEVQKAVTNAIEKKQMAGENARLVEELRGERDNLEIRVEAATLDLAREVEALETMNEQLSAIFEMSRARSIESSTQDILKHILGLLRKTLEFEAGVCVVFDLRAKELQLTYTDGESGESDAQLFGRMLEGHHGELLDRIEAADGPGADAALRDAMRELCPEPWQRDDALFMPLYVPSTLIGVFGVVGASAQKRLSEAGERLLGFAISHFLAVLEERSFLNRTTQLANFGELVTEIAHDLRHPMTSMRGAIKIMTANEGDAARQERCIDHLKTGISRMESMVGELVYFYQPNDMNMATVDLHELLDKAIDATSYLIEQNEIEIVRDHAPGASMILGLTRKLVEAFVNLINNAVQSMEAGGRLTLATGSDFTDEQAERVRTSGRRPDHYIWLTVTDEGRGISEENLRKVFQRFFTTRAEGTGLGLSAVNRIIKKNLGSIEVESKVGKGTTFTIFLPKA